MRGEGDKGEAKREGDTGNEVGEAGEAERWGRREGMGTEACEGGLAGAGPGWGSTERGGIWNKG